MEKSDQQLQQQIQFHIQQQEPMGRALFTFWEKACGIITFILLFCINANIR